MNVNAAETALATLREHCSPEQASALDAGQDFEVRGASGTAYQIRVREGSPVSVSWPSRRGPWVAQLKPRMGTLPKADLALLAKLSIESNEPEWERQGLACGTVWVEDRFVGTPIPMPPPGALIVAQGTEQEVLAQWQQIVAAQQLGLVMPGTIYQNSVGHRFQFNGLTWVPHT